MNLFERLGANIRTLRLANNMSQEELAEKANINENTVKNIESNKGNNVKLDTIVKIADALECDVITLIDGCTIYDDENDISYYRKNDEGREAGKNRRVDIDIHRMYYPPISKVLDGDYYQIMTLMEFIIYLPLFNYSDLIEMSSRITCGVINYEDYIIKQIDYAYKNIPESDAKKYADDALEEIKHVRKRCNYSSDFYEDKFQEYDAYVQLVEQKREMLQKLKDLMNSSFVI